MDASTDPMIVLARRIDPFAREVRKWLRGRGGRGGVAQRREDRQGALEDAGQDGQPRRDLHAAPVLRHRQGLPGGGHDPVAPFTTFDGLYDRSASWGSNGAVAAAPSAGSTKRTASTWTRRSTSSPPPTSSAATPAARSSTGRASSWASSSTATSSRLVLDFVYTEEQARAVSVDSRGDPRGAAQGLRRQRAGRRAGRQVEPFNERGAAGASPLALRASRRPDRRPTGWSLTACRYSPVRGAPRRSDGRPSKFGAPRPSSHWLLAAARHRRPPIAHRPQGRPSRLAATRRRIVDR